MQSVSEVQFDGGRPESIYLMGMVPNVWRFNLVKLDYNGNLLWSGIVGTGSTAVFKVDTQPEIGVDPEDGSVYISAQLRNTDGEFSISGTNYNMKVLPNGSGISWGSRGSLVEFEYSGGGVVFDHVTGEHVFFISHK